MPYDTGNPLIGLLYEFSTDSTIVDIRMLATGNGYVSPVTVNIPTSIVNATATSQLTADQITSITVNVGGYGYQTAPAITFTSSSGSGAVAQAILGGEKVTGDNGASWRILSADYLTKVRNDKF